jgi:hypothetical protein
MFNPELLTRADSTKMPTGEWMMNADVLNLLNSDPSTGPEEDDEGNILFV